VINTLREICRNIFYNPDVLVKGMREYIADGERYELISRSTTMPPVALLRQQNPILT
jgi:hypothetical protein